MLTECLPSACSHPQALLPGGEGVLTGCLPSDGSHPQALLPGWEVVLTTCFPSARSHPQGFASAVCCSRSSSGLALVAAVGSCCAVC